MQGNIVDVYDLAPGAEYGILHDARFINDSTLMGSYSTPYTGNDSPKAGIFDTVGNVIINEFLIETTTMAATEITHDGKLLFYEDAYDNNDEYDAYLFKLNQQLESDTLYTQWYNYDSLCPYQITNDTIPIEGCGLIVGDKEVKVEVEAENLFKVFPNPAMDYFVIENRFTQNNKIITVTITDMQGRKTDSFEINSNESETRISTINYQAGIYLLKFYVRGKLIETEKINIAK